MGRCKGPLRGAPGGHDPWLACRRAGGGDAGDVGAVVVGKAIAAAAACQREVRGADENAIDSRRDFERQAGTDRHARQQEGHRADDGGRPLETAQFLGNAVLFEARIEAVGVSCALGRLAAETGGRSGRCTIRLRPEQFRLSPDGPGCKAVIEDIAFRGGQCAAALRAHHDGAGSRFTAHVSSIDPPAIGSTVFVSVNGAAFLLPEAA